MRKSAGAIVILTMAAAIPAPRARLKRRQAPGPTTSAWSSFRRCWGISSGGECGSCSGTAVLESGAIVAGMLPPIAFLLYSQWAMYGNAFLPGQYWMPNQNIFVHQGMRGCTLPDPQLMLLSLFDPAYGLFTWAPRDGPRVPAGRAGRAIPPVCRDLERRWVVADVWPRCCCSSRRISTRGCSSTADSATWCRSLPLLMLVAG